MVERRVHNGGVWREAVRLAQQPEKTIGKWRTNWVCPDLDGGCGSNCWCGRFQGMGEDLR